MMFIIKPWAFLNTYDDQICLSQCNVKINKYR